MEISGRLPIVEGSLYEPVFGPSGNEELERAIESGRFNLQTDPERAGRGVHAEAREFFQLSRPGLCGSCHDVNLVNGFRLEEAFSEYKHTPAAAAGVSCQDCHMGTEPGVPSGYREGPAARVGDRETSPRKRTNHMFAGPDYSIVHPGIFPHNTEAQALATLREWLAFDHEAGWGTDAFEDTVPDDYEFPPRWTEPDDRYDAADIISDNLELLDELAEQRLALLRWATSSAMSSSIARVRTASSSASSSATAPTATTSPPASMRAGRLAARHGHRRHRARGVRVGRSRPQRRRPRQPLG